MTPQLQQAIRLLQLSTLDLQMEIQQAVESNPLLEMADDFGDDSLPDSDEDRHDDELNTERDDALEEFVDGEPGIETEWDDVYSGQSSSSAALRTMLTTGSNATALPVTCRTTCSGNWT